MSAMPVPPQITSLGDVADETTIKPGPQQWYEEEPTTEVRGAEEVDQNPEYEGPPTEVIPQETTDTLVPDKKLTEVVDSTEKFSKQKVTTLNDVTDQITSLADTTENKVIKEINSAHGTK